MNPPLVKQSNPAAGANSPGGTQSLSATSSVALIVDAIKLRDEAGLGALYDRGAQDVYAYAFSVKGNKDSAEDVVEESFWLAWEWIESYSPASMPIERWLLAVAGKVMGVEDQAVPASVDGLGAVAPFNKGRSAGIRSRLFARAHSHRDGKMAVVRRSAEAPPPRIQKRQRWVDTVGQAAALTQGVSADRSSDGANPVNAVEDSSKSAEPLVASQDPSTTAQSVAPTEAGSGLTPPGSVLPVEIKPGLTPPEAVLPEAGSGWTQLEAFPGLVSSEAVSAPTPPAEIPAATDEMGSDELGSNELHKELRKEQPKSPPRVSIPGETSTDLEIFNFRRNDTQQFAAVQKEDVKPVSKKAVEKQKSSSPVKTISWLIFSAAVGCVVYFAQEYRFNQTSVAETASVASNDSIAILLTRVSQMESEIAKARAGESAVLSQHARVIDLMNYSSRDAQGKVLWNQESGEWQVRLYNFRQPKEGSEFVLWAVANGLASPVNLTKIVQQTDGNFEAVGNGVIQPSQFVRVMITEEPIGANAQTPTGSVVLAGR